MNYNLQLCARLDAKRQRFRSDATPLYFYERALVIYSALVQLQTRSNQLDTEHKRVQRQWGMSEDQNQNVGHVKTKRPNGEHRIFVNCPQYAHWRRESTVKLKQQLAKVCGSTEASQKANLP